MSAEDFFDLVTGLGLTPSGVAALVGVPQSDVVDWLADKRPIPSPVARFLLFLRAANVKPEEVMDALSNNSA